MYHSINFENIKTGEHKNTWDDWGLIPLIRPSFNPPQIKTNYIDIPGADSTIDLTDVLNGRPTYSDREGSFEFFVKRDSRPWYQVYSEISNFLKGSIFKAILEDDKEWYYFGRFFVDSWNSKEMYSTITINYIVNPYKWSCLKTDDDWLWDSFNFYTGIIKTDSFKNIKISDGIDNKISFSSKILGTAPVCPNFCVETDSESIDITYIDSNNNILYQGKLVAGINTIPEIVIGGEAATFVFNGSATLSISFNVGIL